MLRRVFRESYAADSAAPVRVFIFASEHEFEKFRTDPAAAAFYKADEDRDFIVLHEGIALKHFAAHEYLHMVVRHSSAVLPRWMEEGVPEFYSTLSVSTETMHVGEVIEPYLHWLASQLWMDAEDLALGTPRDGSIFYAESWALVHMLSLSPGWSEGMPEFLKLLTAGTEQDEAFTKAFGVPMEDALVALRIYVKRLQHVTLPAPPIQAIEAPEKYQVTRLSPIDSTLLLADLALHTEHRDLARSLFLRAAKDNPQSPAAAAGLGALALAEDRKEDAHREWERAIAMGYRDANTYFQLAMLKNDNSLLEKTLAIDPNFAVAHFLLGVRATDDGNFPAAIEHLRQAVAIRPRRFSFWHALGYAQVKSGDRQGGAESARRAALTASTGQEEEIAAALTLLAAETPTTVHEKRPGVITPQSWQNRKGDARVEGTLTEVNCDSLPVRLLVSVGAAKGKEAKTIELSVEDPTGVVLVNAEGISTTLVCGEQSRLVAVEYLAATKEITRIEFKPVVIIKR